MTRILYTFLISCISINFLSAQTIIDTISLGASYADMAWYSLANGEEARASKTDWHIAFTIQGFSASIQANTAIGVEVYLYPEGDTASWSTVDTAGMGGWTPYYNSTESWSRGAFSQGIDPNDDVDLGWGKYSFITHHVTGDSLFVLKMPDGQIQKLWLEKLAAGVYSFRHGNLDNTMDMSHSIAKADFENKNFAYFNLTTHASANPEPNSDDWDLLFTQYTEFVPTAYTVSGILQNAGVEAIRAHPVNDIEAYDEYYNHSFQSEIDVIGWDWKNFSFQSGWSVEDSMVFFVKAKDETIWKLVLTEFGGSANGNFYLSKTQLTATSVEEDFAPFFNVFPNPMTGHQLNFVVDLPQFEPSAAVSVLDLQGRTVYRETMALQSGMQQYSLALPSLSSGVYVLQIDFGNNQRLHKRIVKR